MSDGMIIENLYTTQVLYINTAAKKILKIEEGCEVSAMREIVNSDASCDSLHHCLKNDFRNDGLSNGKLYLKNLEGTIIEVEYRAFWIEKEKNLISYVFKNEVEVTADCQLSFKEVAEFLPSGVIVLNIEPEFSIAYANAENYKIFGITDVSEAENNAPLLNKYIYEEDVDWVVSEIYDNLYKNLEVDIEFRLKAEDGVLKWIRMFGCAKESSNGVRLFYASIKDLSARREINDKLHLERVLFRKITELANEIMFRVDLETNIVYFFGSNTTVFKNNSAMQNFPQCIIDMNVVMPEDTHIFLQLMDCFKKGISKPIELRLLTQDGEYEWFKNIYNFVTNAEGKPLLVTGKIINIQEQKLLEERAKSDLLTGFYNKITTQNEIDNIFDVEQETVGGDRHGHLSSHSLFIIDIDFFKAINDNLGHHFGDVVLKEVATEIARCFRRYDVFGRIGGDEFVVLMKNCKDESTILNRAQLLCKSLKKTYYGKNDKYSISASVGVAMFPADGMTYEDLYKKADVALYSSKRKGKNCFTFFNESLQNVDAQNITNVQKNRRLHKGAVNSEVIDFVFNLLYETNDILLSVNAVMEYIGELYSVDRCYIYEYDKDGIYKNNYNWISAVRYETKFPNLDEIIVDTLFENAYVDGVIYFNSTDEIDSPILKDAFEIDNITSFFAVKAIKYGDKPMFLGIDICDENHKWEDSEVRTLFNVSRIIFNCIINHNTINRLQKENLELRSKFLDNI